MLCLDLYLAHFAHVNMSDDEKANVLTFVRLAPLLLLEPRHPDTGELGPSGVLVYPCENGGRKNVSVHATRNIEKGETLTLFGNRETGKAYIFRCRCGQRKCQAKLPSDWKTRKPDIEHDHVPRKLERLPKADKEGKLGKKKQKKKGKDKDKDKAASEAQANVAAGDAVASASAGAAVGAQPVADSSSAAPASAASVLVDTQTVPAAAADSHAAVAPSPAVSVTTVRNTRDELD